MPRSEREARQDRRPHRPLTREDLPAELTPETLRHLGWGTLREFSRPDNGVLDPDEQRRFDEALAEVMRGTASVLKESLRRADHHGPANLDPGLRRSYLRAQHRLAEQARRAQDRLPELAFEPTENGHAEPAETEESGSEEAAGDDVSPDTVEQQVEQTSETLDMLERIASLQQQQVEHQHSQLLSETRGFFFAFLVSVAVIVAGVAPLVEAEPHDRLLIALWTVVVTAAAGIVYSLVRTRQGKTLTRTVANPPSTSSSTPGEVDPSVTRTTDDQARS